jgi:hypothetical protein
MTLSPAEIAGMEATQGASMQDVVTITRMTKSVVNYEEVLTPTATEDVACGFGFEGGRIRDEDTHQLLTWEAECRLPRDTPAMDIKTTITPTAIKGKAISGFVFKLASLPIIGPTATILRLVRTTP